MAYALRRNHREKVDEYSQKAFELDPRNALARMFLGVRLTRYGRVDEGIEHLKAALERADIPVVRLQLAQAWHLRGDKEQALSHFLSGVELDAGGAQRYRKTIGQRLFFSRYGAFLDSLGRPGEALRQYTKVLKIAPEKPSVHDQLAALLTREPSADFADALDALIATLEELRATDTPQVLKTLALALTLQEGADTAKALDNAERAVDKLGRNDADALAVLSRAQAARGDLRGAVISLEHALAASVPTPRRDMSLQSYREKLLPRIASYESVDALLTAGPKSWVVGESASWRYFKGRREPSQGLGWTQPGFDDTEWTEGQAGFGHGLHHRYRTWLDDVCGGSSFYTTLYLRKSLRLDDLARIERLLLFVWADDAFVAYLGGEEVGRQYAGKRGTAIAHDGSATEEGSKGRVPSLVVIDRRYLKSGENCLAIQGVNWTGGLRDSYLDAVVLGEAPADPHRSRRLFTEFQAAATDEDRDCLRYMEARLFESEGRYREAVEAYRRLLERNPEHPRLQSRHVECLQRGGGSR